MPDRGFHPKKSLKPVTILSGKRADNVHQIDNRTLL